MANKQDSKALWLGSKLRTISNVVSYDIEKNKEYDFNFLEKGRIKFNTNSLKIDKIKKHFVEKDEDGKFKSGNISIKQIVLHYDAKKMAIRGKVHRFAPYGLEFDSPAEITIPYECTDEEADSLQVYCYNPDINQWDITKKISIDKEANTITFEALHFSDYAPGQGSYKVDESGTFTNLSSPGTVDENLGTVSFSKSEASLGTPGISLAVNTSFNSDYMYSTIIKNFNSDDLYTNVSTGVAGQVQLPEVTQNFYREASGWRYNLPFVIAGANNPNTLKVSMPSGGEYSLRSLISDAYFGQSSTVEGYMFNYTTGTSTVKDLTAFLIQEKIIIKCTVTKTTPSSFNVYTATNVVVSDTTGTKYIFNTDGTINKIQTLDSNFEIVYQYESSPVLTGTVSNTGASDHTFGISSADHTAAQVGDMIIINGESKIIFEKKTSPSIQISGEFGTLPVTGATYQIVRPKVKSIKHTQDGRSLKIHRYTSGDTYIFNVLSNNFNSGAITTGDIVLSRVKINSSNQLISFEKINDYVLVAADSTNSVLNTNVGNNVLQKLTYSYSLTAGVTGNTITTENHAGAREIYYIDKSCYSAKDFIDTTNSSFVICKVLDGSGLPSNSYGLTIINVTKPEDGRTLNTTNNAGNTARIGNHEVVINQIVDKSSHYELHVFGYYRAIGESAQIPIGTTCIVDIWTGNAISEGDAANPTTTLVAENSALDSISSWSGVQVQVNQRYGSSSFGGQTFSKDVSSYSASLNKITFTSAINQDTYPKPHRWTVQSGLWDWNISGDVLANSTSESIITKSKGLYFDSSKTYHCRVSVIGDTDKDFTFLGSNAIFFDATINQGETGYGYGHRAVKITSSALVQFLNTNAHIGASVYINEGTSYNSYLPIYQGPLWSDKMNTGYYLDGSPVETYAVPTEGDDILCDKYVRFSSTSYKLKHFVLPPTEIVKENVSTSTAGDLLSIAGTGSNEIVTITYTSGSDTTELKPGVAFVDQNDNVVNPIRWWYEVWSAGTQHYYYINKPKVTRVEVKDLEAINNGGDFKKINYDYTYLSGTSSFDSSSEIEAQTVIDFSQLNNEDLGLFRLTQTKVTESYGKTSFTNYIQKVTYYVEDGNDLIGSSGVTINKYVGGAWVLYDKAESNLNSRPIPTAYKYYAPSEVTKYFIGEDGTPSTSTVVISYEYDSLGRVKKTHNNNTGGTTFTKYAAFNSNTYDGEFDIFTDYDSSNTTIAEANYLVDAVTATCTWTNESETSRERSLTYVKLCDGSTDKPLGSIDKRTSITMSNLSLAELTKLEVEENYSLDSASGKYIKTSTTEFNYNSNGMLTEIILPDPTMDSININYSTATDYKKYLITKDSFKLPSNLGDIAQYIINEFDYDVKGRMISKSTKFTSDSAGASPYSTKYPAISSEFTYDGMDRLLQKKNTNDKVIIDFTYDDDLRIVTAVSSQGIKIEEYSDEFFRKLKTKTYKPSKYDLTTATNVLVGATQNVYNKYFGSIEQSISYTDLSIVPSTFTATWPSWPTTTSGMIGSISTFDNVGRVIESKIIGKSGGSKVVSQNIYNNGKNAVTSRSIVNYNAPNYIWRESYVKNDWSGRGPLVSASYENERTGLLSTSVLMDTAQTDERKTEYEYDIAGRLISKIIPGENTQNYTYKYSSAGAIEKFIYPDGKEVLKSYDINGNAVATLDQRGMLTKTKYNTSNLPYASIIFNTAASSSDKFIKIETKHSHLGLCSIDKSFSDDGTNYSSIVTYENEYHNTGAILKTKQIANGLERILDFTYSDDGNLLTSKVTSSAGTSAAGGYDQTLTYKPIYHPAEPDTNQYNISAILDGTTPIITKKSDVNPNGVNKIIYGSTDINFTFDEFFRSTGIDFTTSGLTDISMSRDYIGNIIQKNDRKYDYDGMGRLTSISNLSDVVLESYTFDKTSNLKTLNTSEKVWSYDIGASTNNNMLLNHFVTSNINVKFDYNEAGATTRVFDDTRSYDIEKYKLEYNASGELYGLYYKNIETGRKCYDRYWYDQNGLRFKKEEWERILGETEDTGLEWDEINKNPETKMIKLDDGTAITSVTNAPKVRGLTNKASFSFSHHDTFRPWIDDSGSSNPTYNGYRLKSTTYYVYSGNNILFKEVYSTGDPDDVLVEVEHNVIVDSNVVARYKAN